MPLREVSGFAGKRRQTGLNLGQPLTQRGHLGRLRTGGRGNGNAADGLGPPSKRGRVRRQPRDALADATLTRQRRPEAVARPRQRLHRRGGNAQHGLRGLAGRFGSGRGRYGRRRRYSGGRRGLSLRRGSRCTGIEAGVQRRQRILGHRGRPARARGNEGLDPVEGEMGRSPRLTVERTLSGADALEQGLQLV
ncbi:hypothetical protein GCM10025880_59560 [Methylorubrum aminovorans]|nr:hypothetical protein GCM10025880_59560 [Methylorubrum aminovorans]